MSKRWTAADIPQKHQAEAAKQMYPEGHCVSVPAADALMEIFGLKPLGKPKPMSGGVAYQQLAAEHESNRKMGDLSTKKASCDKWELADTGAILQAAKKSLNSMTVDRSKWTPAQSRFVALCEAEGIEAPVPEYRFHPTRKWRSDYAFVGARILMEVDGGLFINGGHSRGKARENDYSKDANALIMGWRVLRVSTGQLKSGLAMVWLKAILAASASSRE